MAANDFVILLVKDHVTATKVVQDTLEGKGYTVRVAVDAPTATAIAKETFPDLVLLDLVLSERSGFEVAKALRQLPGGEDLPIVAFSGYLSDDERQQCVKFGFTDYLFKPVQPAHILETVHFYLQPAPQNPAYPGSGQRILLADDEPSKRKILKRNLEQLGCIVETAEDGLDALDKAKKNPPDVIISDVLMPRLDGFRLCQQIRGDKSLSKVRILLVFSQFTDEEDRELGIKAGADYVTRYTAPDHGEVIDALQKVLVEKPRAFTEPLHEFAAEEFTQKLVRQLENQAAANERCTKRLVLREAELAILASVWETLQKSYAAEPFLEHLLHLCSDTIGLSKSVVLLREDGKLAFTVQSGLAALQTEALKSFFAAQCPVENTPSTQAPKVLYLEMPALTVDERKLLEQTQCRSVLLLPLCNEDECFGMLVFLSDSIILDSGRLAFGQALASQVAQSCDSSRMVQRLRSAEERFLQLTESIEEVFWICSTDARQMFYISPAYEKVWGRSCASLYENPRSFLDAVHPDDQARLTEAVGRLGLGHFNEEYRVIRPDGSVRVIRARGFPIKGESESVSRIAGVAVDITEQKHLETQFRQGQKLEAIGRLSGGVAHDFNNLLTVIKGYAELLLEEVVHDAPKTRDIGEIMKAADAASALTRQLLAFSRRQVLEPQVVNLNTVILNIDKMLERLIGDNIKLITKLHPSLGRTEVDPHQFQQIILNLVINARDAMPQGGSIILETTNMDLDEAYTKEHLNMKAGHYVMMAVTDTGGGMDEKTRLLIFEPFFTTKEAGLGTGLGLSTVYGIVRQSGGHIWVYSEVGRGTTFKIYLPQTLAEMKPYQERVVKPAPALGTETVLLAEDDPNIRKLVDKILKQHGYTVIQISSEEDILEFCKKQTAKIDLLLSDVEMPGKSGPELARNLMEVFPNLKVLYMSGYSDAAIAQRGHLSGGSFFLQKPFTPKILLQKVREVLDKENGMK